MWNMSGCYREISLFEEFCVSCIGENTRRELQKQGYVKHPIRRVQLSKEEIDAIKAKNPKIFSVGNGIFKGLRCHFDILVFLNDSYHSDFRL
jgi:uroporphyrinogen-III synthase